MALLFLSHDSHIPGLLKYITLCLLHVAAPENFFGGMWGGVSSYRFKRDLLRLREDMPFLCSSTSFLPFPVRSILRVFVCVCVCPLRFYQPPFLAAGAALNECTKKTRKNTSIDDEIEAGGLAALLKFSFLSFFLRHRRLHQAQWGENQGGEIRGPCC